MSLASMIGRRLRALRTGPSTIANSFQSEYYQRHNARRLEHLASLGIAIHGRSVLELGAGIGDHTHYYLDRNCSVTATDAREENLRILRNRYPSCATALLDVEGEESSVNGMFDVVHCYGLLYHVSDPGRVLDLIDRVAGDLVFLETCVAFGESEAINQVSEPSNNPTQAYSGTGCRPTRAWLFSNLKQRFAHVYTPLTQPNHAEFPVDWNNPADHGAPLQRSIFIASRQPLANAQLSPDLLPVQTRHA